MKENTEKIEVNCNSGSISDIKVVTRYK